MTRTWTLTLLAFGLGACGGDTEVARIASRWTYRSASVAAPPGTGPEGRALVLLKEGAANGGTLVTIDDAGAQVLEGPFPAPLSDHAPVFTQGHVVLVTKIGKVTAIDLAGATVFSTPQSGGFGLTGPLVVAPDGSLRLGTTAGQLLALSGADGQPLFRVEAGGAIVSAPAVTASGATYAATDLGRVLGVDPAGGVIFDRLVTAPAAGPSLGPGGEVVVGEGDGIRIFASDGTERAKRSRGARVVGTRVIGDRILAWGEDGRVELLAMDGTVILSGSAGASNPPPVYVRPLLLPSGGVGFVDHGGTAHLIDSAGASRATRPLGGAPLFEAAETADGTLMVAVGSAIEALVFTLATE